MEVVKGTTGSSFKNSQTSVSTTVLFYYSERSQSPKWRDAWGQVQESSKQGASDLPLPGDLWGEPHSCGIRNNDLSGFLPLSVFLLLGPHVTVTVSRSLEQGKQSCSFVIHGYRGGSSVHPREPNRFWRGRHLREWLQEVVNSWDHSQATHGSTWPWAVDFTNWIMEQTTARDPDGSRMEIWRASQRLWEWSCLRKSD